MIPQRKIISSTLIALLTMSMLSGCGSGNDVISTSSLRVEGARTAVLIGDINTYQPQARRPSAPLGVYVNLFMSGGGFLQATAAMQAVIAQAKLHAKPSEEVQDNTIALLQEFGTILQVDVPDLLNRSDDRRETLDNYQEALINITERSKLRIQQLDGFVEQLRLEQREQRQTVSQLDRQVRDALREQDYTTAGEVQPILGEAQATLAKTDNELKQQQKLHSTFEDLLEVAEDRILAIEENRQVILSGLTVVDIPGAEDLGILEEEGRGGAFGL